VQIRQRTEPEDRSQQLKLAIMSGNVWSDEKRAAFAEVQQEMAEQHLPQRRPPTFISVVLFLVVPILALIGVGVTITSIMRVIASCSGAPGL